MDGLRTVCNLTRKNMEHYTTLPARDKNPVIVGQFIGCLEGSAYMPIYNV